MLNDWTVIYYIALLPVSAGKYHIQYGRKFEIKKKNTREKSKYLIYLIQYLLQQLEKKILNINNNFKCLPINSEWIKIEFGLIQFKPRNKFAKFYH